MALAACQARPAPSRDAAASPPDLAHGADLGAAPPPADAAVPPPADASLPPPADASLPPADASLPPPADLSPPPDQGRVGMSWPASQVFPSFGSIGALDVIDWTPLPNDQRTLVVTLAGLINRTQPRIYTVDDGGEGKTFWLDKLGATSLTTYTDPFALLTKYRPEVDGLVVYDDAQPDTINLATTIAGQLDGVVASPALAATLTGAPYQLPVLVDLRPLHFGSKLDVYQYELDHYAASATHRLIVGLNPAIPAFLRDYAVATRAMTVWLDPRNAAEEKLLASFLALLPPNSPYLGWWADEPSGVHEAATFGVPVYAADFSSNLTVLGGTPRGSAVTPPTPAPPPLENAVYVALFMSDGDNLQEDQHLVPLKWADAHRGQVPINWTLDPALVDVAPVILRYFQQTATLDDVLVSGPSGLGYTYPAAWPAGVFDQYAKVSGAYLAQAGLRVITVWNNGVDLSDGDAHAYAAEMPGVVGLTIQDESRALRFADDRLPVVRLAVSYGDDAAALETGIDAQLAGWNRAAPLFVAVQGNMNSGKMTPAAFAAVQARYAGNTHVRFVRADHFFQLLGRAHAPPAHRVFGGDFDGDGKTDALMYYAGDGNWWLGRSDGSALDWHLAGNTTGLGNLSDGRHLVEIGDFTGDHRADVLVYGDGDGDWRLGVSDGAALAWQVAGNTNNFGDLLDGAHRLFGGDFDGDGKRDLLFYYRGDGNWWMGRSDGSKLAWHLAGNTRGFGDLLDGGHVFEQGDFNGDGKADLVFFSGDGNWWMGLSDGDQIQWHLAGNTNNFGSLIDPSHQVVSGDFDGDGKTDALMYYNGDGNWWLGRSDGDQIQWHLAGNSAGAGNLLDWNHRLLVGDYSGDGRADVMVYDAGSGAWSLGASDGKALTWQAAGSSAGFGNLLDPSRILLGGDFDGDGRADALFYYGGDGNWWLGASDGAKLAWSKAGNTSGFGDLTR